MAVDQKTQRQARAVTRLAAIAAGKRQFKDALFPGLEIPVKFAVLSCTETQECYAAALQRFGELNMEVTPYTVEPFTDELATQVLYRAVREPGEEHGPLYEKRVAADAADLRDSTTVDQRAAAFQAYRDFQHQVDPDPANLSDEELNEILELVKKKDRAALLALGSASLASFILTTASQQSN